MDNQGVSLASRDGFGQIYDCGSCGNIHVQVGPVTLTLDPDAYMKYVELVSTSAANFEVWLQLKRGKAPPGWEDSVQKENRCEEKES